MTVCITGMHRSGTSMVTRLLNLCGLYLGHATDVVNPESDNRAGFWENGRFVKINTQLLAEFGGAWDLPPVLPPEWLQDVRLLPLRLQASVLIGQFSDQSCWGWKDPRTSLTLPFWRELLPDLHVIICLRHPPEVADSLYRRGYSSRFFSFELWQAYNESLLMATRPAERLVTHHAAYFADAQGELRRLLNWLGWPVADETINRVGASILNTERHHWHTEADLEQAGMPAAGIALYRQLCAEADRLDRPTSNPGGSAIPAAETRNDKAAAGLPTRTGVRRVEVDQSPAAERAWLTQMIEKQQLQIETLKQERRGLQQAFQEQARWAHELESNACAQGQTIQAYQRILTPILPLARLWHRVRKRRS